MLGPSGPQHSDFKIGCADSDTGGEWDYYDDLKTFLRHENPVCFPLTATVKLLWGNTSFREQWPSTCPHYCYTCKREILRLVPSSSRISYVVSIWEEKMAIWGHCVKRQNRNGKLGITKPLKVKMYEFRIHPPQHTTASFAEIYVGRTIVVIFS